MALRTEEAAVMITPGTFENRIVRGIKEHKPNRYAEAGYEDCDDLTGYISLDGKRTPVMTGYWGDAEIWQVDRDNEQWPKCPKCGAYMDIGSALYWRCGACGHSRYAK